MKISKLSLIILFWTLCAEIAHCEPLPGDDLITEVRIGLLAHDVATRSKKHEDGSDLNGEFCFRSPGLKLMRLIGSPRPSMGFSVNKRMNISAVFDHASNGHLAYPNNGLEKFGLQLGYTY